jgi:hypothetical protein
MPYDIMATSSTPALIVYVLDVSGSMAEPLGDRRRIDIVMQALTAAFRRLVFLSTKGAIISPRYRIAMLAYSDHVYDLLDGIRTVDQVAKMGTPELSTFRSTETAKAFQLVEQRLQKELPRLQDCPAPLVCHLTDGEYTGADPEPFARRIAAMRVPDGNVLVENIFISDTVLRNPVGNPSEWEGVRPATPLRSNYAEKLRKMSSPLPTSYHANMTESGFQLARDSVLLFPGISPELVALGFQISTMTGVQRSDR